MKHFLKKHLKSYGPAADGIIKTLRTQSNIWIDLVIAVLVIAAAFYFQVSKVEWLILILCTVMVLSAELINTAIEISLDYLVKEHHVEVGAAKDIAAGGVLVVVIGAAIIGILIFGPHFWRFFA